MPRWTRDGWPCSPTGRVERHRFPTTWGRRWGKRDARCRKPRRYRKLEWRREGFATPRAWKENTRVAEVLRESGKPAVYTGVDVARAKSDTVYFMRMVQQSSITTASGPVLAKLAHLVGAAVPATINATRRKAGRAKHLAAYRADGRFSSLSAFIENERLAAALRGEPKRMRYTLKTLQFTGSFEKINTVMAGAAISVEEWQKQIYASFQLPAEQFKGTSNVSIGSTSPKR